MVVSSASARQNGSQTGTGQSDLLCAKSNVRMIGDRGANVIVEHSLGRMAAAVGLMAETICESFAG
jgi:hypothetical protein